MLIKNKTQKYYVEEIKLKKMIVRTRKFHKIFVLNKCILLCKHNPIIIITYSNLFCKGLTGSLQLPCFFGMSDKNSQKRARLETKSWNAMTRLTLDSLDLKCTVLSRKELLFTYHILCTLAR